MSNKQCTPHFLWTHIPRPPSFTLGKRWRRDNQAPTTHPAAVHHWLVSNQNGERASGPSLLSSPKVRGPTLFRGTPGALLLVENWELWILQGLIAVFVFSAHHFDPLYFVEFVYVLTLHKILIYIHPMILTLSVTTTSSVAIALITMINHSTCFN